MEKVYNGTSIPKLPLVITTKRFSPLYKLVESCFGRRVRFAMENNLATALGIVVVWKTGDPCTIIPASGIPTNLAVNNTVGTTYTKAVWSQDSSELIYFDISDPENVTRFEFNNARGWLGEIPDEISWFPNLERLSIPNNNVSGYVPDISELSLVVLNIGDNRLLTGPPPNVRNSASTLITYNINSCSFFDVFSDFSRFTALITFDTSGNTDIVGPCPILANCLSLVTYNIRSCSIADNYPEWLSNITTLVTIRLDQNFITGTISSLTLLTSLVTINVNNNTGITDYIASSIALTCISFTATGCSLTTASVDQILADFVTNLGSRPAAGSRVISLGGGANGIPSATGLANKATLVTAGWAVTTN